MKHVLCILTCFGVFLRAQRVRSCLALCSFGLAGVLAAGRFYNYSWDGLRATARVRVVHLHTRLRSHLSAHVL